MRAAWAPTKTMLRSMVRAQLAESQTAVVSVPMRLFSQTLHPWREVRQPIPKIPLDFDSLGGIVSSDLGVLGRGVQSSAIVSKS